MGETEINPSQSKNEKAHEWFVQATILASLVLQVLLLFLGSFRMRTPNWFVQKSVDGVYRLSSYVANAAFVLIIGAQFYNPGDMPGGLWAALMLLHLTGQECLTAFSLDDCSDWAWLTFFLGILCRYFLHFLFGINGPNHLPGPTIIIFIVAFIRLLGQTLRLLFLSLDVKKKSVLDTYFSIHHVDAPALLALPDHPMNNILNAHCLLTSSLRFIAGIGHETRLLESMRYHFINQLTDLTSLTVVELNFIYDSFYTDGIIRQRLHWHLYLIYGFLGIYAWACPLAALLILVLTKAAKHKVTYILLGGTIILEFLSFLTMVLSDWTIALGGTLGRFVLSCCPHKRCRWADQDARGALSWWYCGVRVMFRRWSETIDRFNFMAFIIEEAPEGYIPTVSLTGFCGRIRSFTSVSKEWYTDRLGIFIAVELQRMPIGYISSLPDIELQKMPTNFISSLQYDATNKSFKIVLLQLHIATEVLYNCDDRRCEEREHSKTLSDYMAYLLLINPVLSSQIEGYSLDYLKLVLTYVKKMAEGRTFNNRLQHACRTIFELNRPPSCEFGKAVFELIREVTRVVDGITQISWGEVGRMWVELLLRAASKIDSRQHVRGLSQGAELVTLVWLFASHLGLFMPKT